MAELARVPAGTLTRRTPAAIAAKALAPATSLPRVAMAQAGGAPTAGGGAERAGLHRAARQ